MNGERALCAAGCGALVGSPWQKCHACATAAVQEWVERRDALERDARAVRRPRGPR